MVGHNCTHRYSEGGDWEDCGLRPAWTKVSKTPISTKKPGMVIISEVPVMWQASVGGLETGPGKKT
jgi:hypothetical protein